MRIKRMISLILLVLIIVILLPSVSTESNQQPGNTYGNTNNYGLIAQSGDFYYFSNGYDSWKLYSIKKNDILKRKISDDSVQYINVSDNIIYYSNTSDGWKLYRIGIDGRNRQKLNDDHSEYVSVYDGFIYYINVSDDWKITRMYLDGSGKRTITDDAASSLNVSQNWIYYINWSDNRKIYRISVDGTSKQKLTDDSARQINLYGDKVYYINDSDEGRIYSVNVDNTGASGRKKVSNGKALQMNIFDGNVYFSNAGDGYKLYKISTDASAGDGQLIRSDKTYVFNLVENWIYFCSYYEENSAFIYYEDFMRASHDGTKVHGQQEMYDSEKAAEVIVKIQALPLPMQMKLEDKALVESVRAAYDALSDSQKELVSNYLVLTAAEERIWELEPKVISSDTYQIDQTLKIITKINPGTTVQSVMNSLSGGSGTIEAFDSKGSKVTSGNIGTGYKFRLTLKGKVVNEITAVIYGDVNGDGNITSTDMLIMELHILKKKELTGVYKTAGCIVAKDSQNKNITSTDMLRIELHILKLKQIDQ